MPPECSGCEEAANRSWTPASSVWVKGALLTLTLVLSAVAFILYIAPCQHTYIVLQVNIPGCHFMLKFLQVWYWPTKLCREANLHVWCVLMQHTIMHHSGTSWCEWSLLEKVGVCWILDYIHWSDRELKGNTDLPVCYLFSDATGLIWHQWWQCNAFFHRHSLSCARFCK